MLPIDNIWALISMKFSELITSNKGQSVYPILYTSSVQETQLECQHHNKLTISALNKKHLSEIGYISLIGEITSSPGII